MSNHQFPDGMAVIVDNITDSVITTDLDNQFILIECSDNCGDISISTKHKN